MSSRIVILFPKLHLSCLAVEVLILSGTVVGGESEDHTPGSMSPRSVKHDGEMISSFSLPWCSFTFHADTVGPA